MKYYIFILIVIFLSFTRSIPYQDKNEIYRHYIGGRSMYTGIDIKLLYDGQYEVELWSKKFSVKDSGNYCISDDGLIMNSFKTTYKEKKFKYTRDKWYKKKKRDLFYDVSDTPHLHISDTFRLRDDTLFYFDDREINDSADIRFNRVYRTLIDKKSADNPKENPCISPK